MTLDLNKPVQTRDGRKARILCTDFKNRNWTLVAAIENATGEVLTYHQQDGRYGGGAVKHEADLVNVPDKWYAHIWNSPDGPTIGNLFRHNGPGTPKKPLAMAYIKTIEVEV